MTKREKVIKGLKCCAYAQVECFCPEDCPYHEYDTEDQDCIVVLHNNALDLLKAQEPRVMTLEEAKNASGYVFVQSCSCNILELQLIKDGFVYDSFAVPIAVDDLW